MASPLPLLKIYINTRCPTFRWAETHLSYSLLFLHSTSFKSKISDQSRKENDIEGVVINADNNKLVIVGEEDMDFAIWVTTLRKKVGCTAIMSVEQVISSDKKKEEEAKKNKEEEEKKKKAEEDKKKKEEEEAAARNRNFPPNYDYYNNYAPPPAYPGYDYRSSKLPPHLVFLMTMFDSSLICCSYV